MEQPVYLYMKKVSRVKRQERKLVIFFDCAGSCTSRSNTTSIINGDFTASMGMAPEPGMVYSPRKWASKHCFVSAAILGPHPPYLPHLATCDFFFFLRTKL
jgi:hypothetical protein